MLRQMILKRRKNARRPMVKPRRVQVDKRAIPIGRLLARIGGTLSALLLAYVRVVRPWFLRWSAHDDEVQRALPGDNMIPNPKLAATHALTINAPAPQVWQWIAQMGQGRGGLYTYDWLENLMFRLNMHSADRILPEFQNLQAGDVFPLAPGGFGPSVLAVEPGKHLLIGGKIDPNTGGTFELSDKREGNFFAVSWLYYLEPLDAYRTRVIERFRADWHPSLANNLYIRAFLEPGAFIFERGMLRGIKQRAEASEEAKRCAHFKTAEGRAEYLSAYDTTLRLWGVPYEEMDVSTRFGATHLIVAGPTDAPPLVLLSGLGLSATMWFPNIADLSYAHRVYALDTLGDVGKSVLNRLNDYPKNGQACADWLIDIFNALEIRQADVVGLSYGSWLTLNLARYAPARVRKIVLSSPPNIFAPLNGQFLARFLLQILIPARALTEKNIEWLCARRPNEVYVRQLLATKHFNVRVTFPRRFGEDALRCIETPTLVLIGDSEVIAKDPRQDIQRAHLLPHVETGILPAAKHFVTMDQPELVDARILEFLDAPILETPIESTQKEPVSA